MIDENEVEEAFARIRNTINLTLLQDVPHLEALMERLRLEMILGKIDRDRRNVYRSIIDLLDATLERRYAESDGDGDRETVRQHVVRYFRRLLHDLSENDEADGR